jgi:hypothetical protein
MPDTPVVGEPGARTTRVRFGPAPRSVHWQELGKVARAMQYTALAEATRDEDRKDPHALFALATILERVAEEAMSRDPQDTPDSYWAAQDVAFKWMADRLPAEETL